MTVKDEVNADRGEVKDLTDRRQIEDALRNSEEEARGLARENAILADSGQTSSSSLDIGEVFQAFAGKVSELIPHDRISVNVVDMELGTYKKLYVQGIRVPDRELDQVYELSGSLTGKVASDRSGTIMKLGPEPDSQLEVPGVLPIALAGISTVLSIPLQS